METSVKTPVRQEGKRNSHNATLLTKTIFCSASSLIEYVSADGDDGNFIKAQAVNKTADVREEGAHQSATLPK